MQTLYYTGIQGMVDFKRDYGHSKGDGTYVLLTTFLAVSASIIYVGEFSGSLLAGPINDLFRRRTVFLSVSLCIIVSAVI